LTPPAAKAATCPVVIEELLLALAAAVDGKADKV